MDFRRDRLTWVAYALLAWFAYLQAAPGLVVPHLRDELDLSYSVGGLHVAAFAAGSVIAGVASGRLERALGRRALFWSSAALMGAMTVALTLGRTPVATIGALLVMGVGGTLLLITIQAALADHHGERRAIALTEANVAASVAYVVLIGALSLAAATGAGLAGRAAGLVAAARGAVAAQPARGDRRAAAVGRRARAAPAARSGSRRRCSSARPPPSGASRPGARASSRTPPDVSADTAVALMVGFYVGVVAGRVLGSRLARSPSRRTGCSRCALVVTAVGFAVLWPSASAVQAVLGLLVVGLGLGNLFPLGLAVTVALAPDRAQLRVEPGGAGERRRGAARAAHGGDARRCHVVDRGAGGRPGVLALAAVGLTLVSAESVGVRCRAS